MKNKKVYTLPKPYKDKETKKYIFHPVKRLSRVIPFGYKLHEEDPTLLLPIQEELELLEQAKIHLRKYSYRKVAEWLSAKSGRYISFVGLRQRVNSEYRIKGATSFADYRARKTKKEAERAAEEAERLKGRVGTKETITTWENPGIAPPSGIGCGESSERDSTVPTEQGTTD